MRMPWLTTLLAITLACTLSACGGGDGGNSGNGSSGSNGSSSNSGGGGSGSNSGSGSGSTGGQTAYLVTPSVNGAGGAISSSTPVSAQPGATPSFTLTPNSGYSIGSVGGTCGGSLSGNTYTTQPVTANCTVVATFTRIVQTVTVNAGTGGTIAPSGKVSVNSGDALSLTVTPGSGYTPSIGGTCGGTLNGNTYTIDAVTADCAIEATFTQTSPEEGTLAECYEIPPSAKSYEVSLTIEGGATPGTYTEQISLAPATFMGQAAWETTNVGSIDPHVTYSTLANDYSYGCDIAEKDMDGTFVYPTPRCTPFNIKPGDSYDLPSITRPSSTIPGMVTITPKEHFTFIGFESVTVNGKTFSKACHLKRIDELPDGTSVTADDWFAENMTVRSYAVGYPDGSTVLWEFKRNL